MDIAPGIDRDWNHAFQLEPFNAVTSAIEERPKCSRDYREYYVVDCATHLIFYLLDLIEV